jgi:precorrin-2 dehydrogenase/sirohydrochlorin ferrochelatase
MMSYPICLIGMERRHAVVVGAGKVAERKVAGLLGSGAQVTVIGPSQTEQLLAWAQAGAITLISRRYCYGDLAGAFLAVAATDDSVVNQTVCDEARAGGCLINSVEHPERSDFVVPAVVRRGDVSIAISTGGASPALARHLRRRVEQVIGPEYASVAALLAELRPILSEQFPDDSARSAAVEHLLASCLFDRLGERAEDTAMRRALELLEALASNGAWPGADGEGPPASQSQERVL